jgi:hypothetical protein
MPRRAGGEKRRVPQRPSLGFAVLVPPTLTSVTPSSGPGSGGDLVALHGTFGTRVAVRFGTAAAEVVAVHDEASVSVGHVRTPPHAEGVVDVTVTNLDAAGAPIAGESIILTGAYTYQRPRIVQEANLTRLVRTLLRELKRQVLPNVSLSVSVEFDEPPYEGAAATAIAKLPSLVLTGPRIKENRFYSVNALGEEIVTGTAGPEVRRRRPPLTVDLEFAITGASDRAVELLNLMTAVAGFLDRNRWLSMDRDPSDPSKGAVRWEMDASGELQTNLEGKDDVRAFTRGLIIRGFDLDEGLPIDLAKAVADAGAEVGVASTGGAP